MSTTARTPPFPTRPIWQPYNSDNPFYYTDEKIPVLVKAFYAILGFIVVAAQAYFQYITDEGDTLSGL